MDHRRVAYSPFVDVPQEEKQLALSYWSVGWTPPGLARAKDLGALDAVSAMLARSTCQLCWPEPKASSPDTGRMELRFMTYTEAWLAVSSFTSTAISHRAFIHRRYAIVDAAHRGRILPGLPSR